MKVGFMGGSFNPIHSGHLDLAKAAKKEYNLDKVLFIPNNINPIKENKTNATNEDRINMVNLAIKDENGFEIDTFEIEKKGVSYTIDTVNYLKSKYDNLYFICGADLIFEIDLWKDYEKLLKSVNFIIANRVPYTPLELEEAVKVINKKYGSHINILKDFEFVNLSSSEIRTNIKNDVSFMMPPDVFEYIRTHNLYLV